MADRKYTMTSGKLRHSCSKALKRLNRKAADELRAKWEEYAKIKAYLDSVDINEVANTGFAIRDMIYDYDYDQAKERLMKIRTRWEKFRGVEPTDDDIIREAYFNNANAKNHVLRQINMGLDREPYDPRVVDSVIIYGHDVTLNKDFTLNVNEYTIAEPEECYAFREERELLRNLQAVNTVVDSVQLTTRDYNILHRYL